jgi:hypothetical protein
VCAERHRGFESPPIRHLFQYDAVTNDRTGVNLIMTR